MFQLIKPDTNFDFIGKGKFFISISIAFVLFSFVIFVTKGLKFGIDFSGGTELSIHFNQKIDTAEVRKILSDAGFKDSSVQHFGSEGPDFSR